jgi:hypothetical protein
MHHEVFPTDPRNDFRQKIISPLMTFRPTRRCNPTRPASLSSLIRKQTKKSRSTLLRFCAPPALWHRAATNTGISNSRLCSALRFSQPLNALLRPTPLRPCFMPLTLMGFSLQRFPPAGIRTPSDARSPPDVTSRVPLRFRRQAAFRITFPVRPSSGV